MSQNEEIDAKILNESATLGLKPMSFGPGVAGLGRLELGEPTVVGICKPVESHSALLVACQWYQGPTIIVQKESPRFILWDQFFCLETPDIPKDVLQLRDHFDYTLEHEIQERFGNVSPIFGPTWRYLFPCENFVKNLRNSVLSLSTPFMGNALNCRSNSLERLLAAQEGIRAHLATKLPIPMVWAFPEGLPVGDKDNFYDTNCSIWYMAQIKSDFEGAMSLVDLRPNEAGVCSVMQHDFQGNIHPVEMKANEITVQFTAVGGQFRSRRRLSRLKMTYLW